MVHIALVAKLHDQVEVVSRQEAVLITHDIPVFYFLQKLGFVQRNHVSAAVMLYVYFLEDIGLIIKY